MSYSCSGVYAHDTVSNACFSFKFIDTRVSVLALHLAFSTPLGIYHTTRWRVLTLLDLHVQISKLRACRFFRLLIRDAQTKRGSLIRPSRALSFQAPVLVSRVFFVTLEHLLYYSSLYISLYSRICTY